MIITIRNRIRHSPESSRIIGESASQQVQAYNFGVEYTLAHPNISKYDLFKKFTESRMRKPEKWFAQIKIIRAGLTRGFNSVRSFDKATLNTLRECIKERDGKNFKHVKQNPNTRRLLKARKDKLSVFVDDSSSIRLLDANTLRVAGLTLGLIYPLPLDANIKAIQILERKSSLRCNGRNSPLSCRKYDAHVQVYTPDPTPKNPLDNPVGLDTGIANTLTDSDGNFHEQPVVLQDMLQELMERQKRCTRGSRQHGKLQRLINKEKKYHRNVISDWEHRIAKHLAETYSTVIVEKLSHRNLRKSTKGTTENPGMNVSQKRGLNRSWARTRPAMLHQTLARHSEKTGASFVAVAPKFTSQTCPVCGLRTKESRKSQAEFACLNCGFELHADTVGSWNILESGVEGFTGEVHRGWESPR